MREGQELFESVLASEQESMLKEAENCDLKENPGLVLAYLDTYTQTRIHIHTHTHTPHTHTL